MVLDEWYKYQISGGRAVRTVTLMAYSQLVTVKSGKSDNENRCYTCLLIMRTKQFADEPTRGQSSRGLVSSLTSQLADSDFSKSRTDCTIFFTLTSAVTVSIFGLAVGFGRFLNKNSGSRSVSVFTVPDFNHVQRKHKPYR